MFIITIPTFIASISMINVLDITDFQPSVLKETTFGPWPTAAGARSAVLEPPIPNNFIAAVILRCCYL